MPHEAEGEKLGADAPAAPGEPGRGREALSALLVELAQPEPDAAHAWHPPATPRLAVGRFELLRELGRGGFGVVYEARDRELGRLVAFKAVRPGASARAAQREAWLRREAEAAAQLSHENIVALHDAGRSELGPYLVFELLEGETLAERLARGPLPPLEAVRVAAAVARALAYAHAAGVLHRDLKPSNVFLTERGQVKVLDFGLAHVFGWTAPVSGGTPAYMAPEQWRGATEDARTDVFALGVMLHEMVTGRLPFAVHEGRSGAVDPAGPAPTLEGVPAPLRPVVASAISPDPAARPRNAEVLLEQLARAERTLATRARPRRHGRAVAGAGVALVAGLSALGVWWAGPPTVRAPARVEAGAPAATAADLDAYAHYFRAREAADAARLEEAVDEIERALELDPALPLAHYLRAHLGEFTGVPLSTRRAHIETALRYSERLPPKERLLVQAWGAHVRGDDTGAGHLYRSAVQSFPGDADVLYFAGDFGFHAGDLEGAAELFQRAMDARPGWAPPLVHLVETLDGIGRLDRALPLVRRAVATAPNPATYTALADAHLALGDLDEAVRALRAAVAAGGGPNTIQMLGDALLRASRLDEAEAEARRLMGAEAPPSTRLAGHRMLVKLRAYQGRYREALRLLDEIPSAVRAANPNAVQSVAVAVLTVSGADPGRLWLEARAWGSLQLAAIHLAYAGDLAHASQLARGMGPGTDRDLFEGIVAWRRGQRELALERLRAGTRHGANPRPLGLHMLAEVLAELGRDEEALEMLVASSRAVRSTQVLLHPRALLIGARVLERRGRVGEARARVDQLLALWKDADPDVAAVEEARALGARLVRSEGRARVAGPSSRPAR